MATLWIKNVPAPLAAQLNERAERNGRSLQAELRAILDEVVRKEDAVEALSRAVKKLGLKGPSESAAMIRADRDGYRR